MDRAITDDQTNNLKTDYIILVLLPKLLRAFQPTFLENCSWWIMSLIFCEHVRNMDSNTGEKGFDVVASGGQKIFLIQAEHNVIVFTYLYRAYHHLIKCHMSLHCVRLVYWMSPCHISLYEACILNVIMSYCMRLLY